MLGCLVLPVALADAARVGALRMQVPAAASAVPAAVSSSAPSEAVWNDNIREAWCRAYASAPAEPADYEIEEITGEIPAALSGTVFRNGPGNFERGGERFKHVLDGDGLLCRWSLDGATGRARFASRFVETPYFEEETAADRVLHRNTFGTQPEGATNNAFNLVLKNPANTNVQAWGGKCLALWEAALPSRIAPETLEYMCAETFDGLLPDGGMTVTSGVDASLDRALGLGVAFTAHPREDRKGGRFVGWTWAAPLVGKELAVTLYEWDTESGAVVETTRTTLPSAIAPHDFGITDDWYVFALNAMELKLMPYVLGLTGPVGALGTTGGGVTLRLVPRPGGRMAHREPLTIETDEPCFAIHHATAYQEAEGSVIKLLTAAWPEVGEGPFLGDWGGDVPVYDDGKINPTLLLEHTIRVAEGETPSVSRGKPLVDGACIDHPHVDPRFEGDAGVRYVFMSYCNPEGNSGSPPLGWARLDLRTGETRKWTAPPRCFCEEVVVIPRPVEEEAAEGDGAREDTADVWIAAHMFDADKGKTCLCILDGDDLEAGPVCQLWLRSFIPHGLHGCYVPDLHGVL